MKALQSALLGFFTLAAACLHAGVVSSFDDILLWTGSGSNRAALVVDFHDGQTRQSFVWGFRWNGSATAFDMLTAIDSAWPELTLDSRSFVNEIQYTTGLESHSQAADWIAQSWGYYVAGGTATQFSNDPPYGPTGTLTVPGGGISLPTLWTISPAGSADRQLADGSWDAFSFGAFDTQTYEHLMPPSSVAYAAVPEPSVALLGCLAGGLLLSYVRTQKSRVHAR